MSHKDIIAQLDAFFNAWRRALLPVFHSQWLFLLTPDVGNVILFLPVKNVCLEKTMSQKYHLESFPIANTYRLEVPALSADSADEVLASVVAPFDGFVSQVQFVPNAGMAGGVINNRTLRVVNKTTPVAGGVAATLALDGTNGTNAVAAFAPLNVPVTAAPVDNVNAFTNTNYVAPTVATPTASTFKKGDVLDWESIHNGSGIADPGGVVILTLQKFE